MKIITFTKTDDKTYSVVVEEDCVRNVIFKATVSKDSIDYSRLIHATLDMWGVRVYNTYNDWAGTIIVEKGKEN